MTRAEAKAHFEARKAVILRQLAMERQVKEELRAQGVKLAYVRRADIVS